MNQKIIADRVVQTLTKSGQFDGVVLIGSIADGKYDDLSDIDIIVQCSSRSPWDNVTLASGIVEEEHGCLLQDWAGSLIPNKYLISHYLPNCSIMWWLDIGCMPDEGYGKIARSDIHVNRDIHMAKLLIMNAKHFIRETNSRLRIWELFEKATSRKADGLDVVTMFHAVYEEIDYSGIPEDFRRETNDILQIVANKAVQWIPLRGATDL
jgi:hypothetical protein